MTTRDELRELADEYWDSVMEAYPSFATLLGDRRFDDRIEDVSAEAERQLQSRWVGLLDRVDALDPAGLEPADHVTRSLLRVELANGIEGLDLRLTELASDQMTGIHADMLTNAPQINAPTPESAAALVERHRRIGTLLDQAVERFRAGLAAGRTPARLAIERSVHQLDGYLASPIESDPFVTLAGPGSGSGSSAGSGGGPGGGDGSDSDSGWDGEAAWREELATVAREVIRPAFQRYRDVLAGELLPAARPDDRCGLAWLDDRDEGARIYRTLIRQHTTLDGLDAEEIHRIGLAEIDRLAEEYADVGQRLFGTRELATIFDRLRRDPKLRYTSGDEMMADARRCLEAAAARMGDWFGRLPRAECEIKPVPDFLADDAPGAYYFPPAADGSRPGAYFVNSARPAESTRFETAAVAFHEAIPGHHLQLTIASELEELPRFQRFSWSNTAFVEGWALYSERLADEMGLYRDDLDRIGMLAADSWRSARLVVDTGIHALGWSREQAVDCMVANVPVSRDLIEVEVDRYVAMPGQALGYKVGQLEIQQLRRQTQQARGSAFDIKAFHDAVLGSGSVSLPALREVVSRL
jgi:uncharacterized protein (DUF885 family)